MALIASPPKSTFRLRATDLRGMPPDGPAAFTPKTLTCGSVMKSLLFGLPRDEIRSKPLCLLAFKFFAKPLRRRTRLFDG
jgi:hypothetical protein